MPLLFVFLLMISMPAQSNEIEITVLYNNVPYAQGCECQWGFACLIRGPQDTILFDTGGNGNVLLRNMELLQVDPAEIDCVVLSHRHGDHTGGVASLLPRMNPARWYVPADFVAQLRGTLERAGHTVIPVTEPVQICAGVFSTGELGSAVKEQLQALGVQKVAPSHCTGEKAMRLFAEIWKENYISSGCGARITIP